MENIIKLRNNGSSLGLRLLAKQISINIRAAITKNEEIVLDFDKVNSISSSFADELIAKIMFDVGEDKFIRLVKIRHTNDFIKKVINHSIQDRKNLDQ